MTAAEYRLAHDPAAAEKGAPGTTGPLMASDWGLALMAAASVLFLDEARTYLGKHFRAHDVGR
jgi:hypothetical protein